MVLLSSGTDILESLELTLGLVSKFLLGDDFGLEVTARLAKGLYFPNSENDGATPLLAFSMCILSSDFLGVSRMVGDVAVIGEDGD